MFTDNCDVDRNDNLLSNACNENSFKLNTMNVRTNSFLYPEISQGKEICQQNLKKLNRFQNHQLRMIKVACN